MQNVQNNQICRDRKVDQRLLSADADVSIEGWLLRYKVSVCRDENVPKLIVVMFAQFCAYTRNHWIDHFKWVNCMVCEFYLKLFSLHSRFRRIKKIQDNYWCGTLFIILEKVTTEYFKKTKHKKLCISAQLVVWETYQLALHCNLLVNINMMIMTKIGNVFFCILVKDTYSGDVFLIFSVYLCAHESISSCVCNLCITWDAHTLHANEFDPVHVLVILMHRSVQIAGQILFYSLMAALVLFTCTVWIMPLAMWIILVWPCQVLWPLVLGVHGSMSNRWALHRAFLCTTSNASWFQLLFP